MQCGSSFILASTYENQLYFWGTRYYKPCLRTSDTAFTSQYVKEMDSISRNNALNDTSELLADFVKLGDSNLSLMNIVEKIGPDFPVLQVKDPQVIVDSYRQLMMLRPSGNNSLKSDLILKPQSVVALYSSQVHLQYGETINFADFYCFDDDNVYIVIDTTISLSTRKETVKRPKKITTLALPKLEEEILYSSHESLNNSTPKSPRRRLGSSTVSYLELMVTCKTFPNSPSFLMCHFSFRSRRG